MGDHHWATLGGGRAVMEEVDGTVYLAMSLRNVGSGLAVLRGWWVGRNEGMFSPTAAMEERRAGLTHVDPEAFRPQGRDLDVPSGDVSFWQAAIRNPEDPSLQEMLEAIAGSRPIVVDLLYGDHEGGQRAISRFSLTRDEPEEPDWQCSVVRHWYLDRREPR